MCIRGNHMLKNIQQQRHYRSIPCPRWWCRGKLVRIGQAIQDPTHNVLGCSGLPLISITQQSYGTQLACSGDLLEHTIHAQWAVGWQLRQCLGRGWWQRNINVVGGNVTYRPLHRSCVSECARFCVLD